MVKKLSLLGLCVLGLLLPTWSQKGPTAIEYLAMGSTGSTTPFQFRPPDPTVQTAFKSDILLSFDVPPYPKSPAIFLDIWAQYLITWTPNPVRRCAPLIYFKIVSPAIPNIEFSQAYGVPPQSFETNYALDHSYPTNTANRNKGYAKMPLRRGFLEWWWVVDTNTGQRPPDDLVLSYIDTIIDSGFKVEVWAEGQVQGVSYIAPFAFQVIVTGLHKK